MCTHMIKERLDKYNALMPQLAFTKSMYVLNTHDTYLRLHDLYERERNAQVRAFILVSREDFGDRLSLCIVRYDEFVE